MSSSPEPSGDDRTTERPRAPWVLRWPVEIIAKLARVVPDAAQRFYADRCPQQAAGIAYRVLFSVAPLAIVLVSIFGLVLRNDSVRRDVVSTVVDALPVSVAGKNDVEDAITALPTLQAPSGSRAFSSSLGRPRA